jgi:hypothetical protein
VRSPTASYESPPFMKEFDGVPRGVLEARCYAAEVKIRQARVALEAGDVHTAASILGAVLQGAI